VKEFDQMEIMYVLNESVWGKGYASEASLYFKQLAKEQGLTFLIGLAHKDNIASQKVLLKTGYQEIKQVHIWGLDCFYYEMDL
jgi:RimJ/RimL family protein N-acetyltransferase